MVDQPHHPSGQEQAADEIGEAVSAVVQHLARLVALGYAEDDGGAEGADEGRAEMRELQSAGKD